MIGKTIFSDGRTYICDDCGKNVAKFKNYDEARAAGWAIAYFRDSCYCPKCAPKHRRGEAKKKNAAILSENGGQLRIENL